MDGKNYTTKKDIVSKIKGGKEFYINIKNDKKITSKKNIKIKTKTSINNIMNMKTLRYRKSKNRKNE